MRLTDEDLNYLFRFGMGMQRLDQDDDQTLRGLAEPHEGNCDWINLWIADGANTVIPRDVEHDGIGGYLFTDPWGGRRRVFPLPEAESVSFGSWNELYRAATEETTTGKSVTPGRDVVDSGAVDGTSSSATEYLLVHYNRDGYPLGIWQSPARYFYGLDTQDDIRRGSEVVTGWDESVSWPEWIDSIAWDPPDPDNRWDMFKGDEPTDLEGLLEQLRNSRPPIE